MKLTAEASGVYVIAPTPFDDEGRARLDLGRQHGRLLLGCGVAGLTILGIMGEAPKLDAAEALGFVKQVLARSGGVPVTVGVSAPGFAAMRISRAP